MVRNLGDLFLWLFICHITFIKCQTTKYGKPGYQLPRKEILDEHGKYVLEWTLDWAEHTITFNITAETIGWVGFGLSNNGKMSGADVIIGGMYNNGQPYFSDRHAVKGDVPVEDPSQDWTLEDCVEAGSGSHTFLSVKRKLDTCDDHDYPITENRVSVIWAYGKSDKEITYHKGNRGSYDLYLLDPNWSPGVVRDRNTKDPTIYDMTGLNTPSHLETWTIPRKIQIPREDTSYLCSMHQGPELKKKHHVIGFDVFFGDEASRRTVHHLIVYKCNLPSAGLRNGTTTRDVFGTFVGREPETCYSLLRPPMPGAMPMQWCTENYFGWAAGGRSFFNPVHVGFPLGNDAGEDEYYVVQIHYDNPEERDNFVVDVRIDMFYTNELRDNEGGMMMVAHAVPGQPESLLIPPDSPDHRIYGHCSPECSRRMLGPGGKINVYSALLHAHNAGSKIRLHHFRKGKELPWIAYDDNWSSDFQHFRNFRKETEIMAGDQLTIDCSYDASVANGSTIVGGYSTRQEMCLAYLVYYNRIQDYHTCASDVMSEGNRRRFLNGVGRVTWNESRLGWVANEPREMEGYTVQEISDNFVMWDKETRAELQKEQTVRPHQGSCYREPYSRHIPILPFAEGLSEDDFRGPVHYPLDVEVYLPPQRNCSA